MSRRYVAVAFLLLNIVGCGSGQRTTYHGKTMDYWLTQLRADDAERREKASIALGKIGENAIAPLLSLLHEKDQTLRLAAIDALGKMYHNAEKATPDLIALLKDDDPKVQAAAARSLGRIGSGAGHALPQLRKLLASPDRDCRYEAVYAMWLLERAAADAAPDVTPLLEDSDVEIRRQAARTLGVLKNKAAIPALVSALDDDDRRVGLLAGFALQHLDQETAGQHGYH